MSLKLLNEVLNTIPYYVEKNKRLLGLLRGIGITFVIIASVGFTSFYTGKNSVHKGLECPVSIDIVPFTASVATSTQESHSYPKPQKTSMSIGSGAGGVVVSKNGSKYHFPWCAGAGQIKEENKIWFATEAEAQSAGYTKAGNCQ